MNPRDGTIGRSTTSAVSRRPSAAFRGRRSPRARRADAPTIFQGRNGLLRILLIRFYFLNPTPVEADKTIDLWGIKKPVPLADWKTAADDSVLPSEFDEAVIKLSLATALKKEKRYDEAAVEIAEVETPANPNVPGSGGILAKLADQEEGKVGYIGRARSSKFEM